jgi:hypothetical protein
MELLEMCFWCINIIELLMNICKQKYDYVPLRYPHLSYAEVVTLHYVQCYMNLWILIEAYSYLFI